MLELREYSKCELIELYKTDRIDAIKLKLKSQGYTFENIGRGDDYKMKITALPCGLNGFKMFCKEKLKFDSHTDFNKLALFMKNIFDDEDFMQLQYKQMARVMQTQGLKIGDTTISGYLQQLYEMDWIADDIFEFNYYIYDCTLEQSRPITKEEYRAAWAAFREGTYNSANEAIGNLYNISSGMPKKKPKVELNGIYKNDMEQLQTILRSVFE